MRFEDLTGKRFGRLTVIKRVYKEGDKQTYWLCKCDCGNETVACASHLKDGHTKSCGCFHKEELNKSHTKHGLSKHHLYKVYKAMKQRTTKGYDKRYKNYGGRGIVVCDEWMNDFNKFYEWAISSGYKDGLTIDRINTSGNYEPSNCRWVTYKAQENNRTNNHYITYNGETHTMKQWSELLCIPYTTLAQRLNKYHWTVERALNG